MSAIDSPAAASDYIIGQIAPKARDDRIGSLVDFIGSLRYEVLPEAVRQKVRLHLLDTLGVALAATSSDQVERLVGMRARTEGSAKTTSLIGRDERFPPAGAAFVNSVMTHIHDYDDTHLASVTHPSAVVVPAALALGEQVGATTNTMVTALAAGYEVMIRLGLGTEPAHVSRLGRLPSAVWGVIGSAATATKLLGLDAIETDTALRLAAGMTPVVAPGAAAKTYAVGWAAQAGVNAALMASSGVHQPSAAVLEGSHSLYWAATGQPEPRGHLVTEGLGQRWEMLDICPKVYACCHDHQGLMDVGMVVREKHGITPADICSLVCRFAPGSMTYRVRGIHQGTAPANPYMAKFSAPFGLALVLAGKRAGPRDFTEEAIIDETLTELIRKVRILPDETGWSGYPESYSGWLEVRTRDGRWIIERLLHNRGTTGNPISEQEYRDKFDESSAAVLSPPRRKSVADLVLAGQDVAVSRVLSETRKAA